MAGTRRLVQICLGLALAVSMLPLAQRNACARAEDAAGERQNIYAFKLGYLCHRVSDGGLGVVKRDACGQWYCSDREVQDIAEKRPNIASEIGCTWRLEGQRCVCRRQKELQAVPGAR